MQQIAFEVVCVASNHARLIKMLEFATSQIASRVIRMLLAVDDALDAEFATEVVRVCARNVRSERAVQFVVVSTKRIASTVPGEQRFNGSIVQHPLIPGIHAVLEK